MFEREFFIFNMFSVLLMVKTFRRECHRVLPSERTTVHGADGMLMVLQLAMAEVNKQLGREFKVALSDVLMAWKHLLLEKLHLPPPGFARPESYDLMREAYEAFLKRSNTVDLLDVASMYGQLRVADLDPEDSWNFSFSEKGFDFFSFPRSTVDSAQPTECKVRS
uniref:PCNA-interacting partner n=1 Tax=Salarias fasciatus TaxID=181472 RepID=A0A672J6E9_SALFA